MVPAAVCIAGVVCRWWLKSPVTAGLYRSNQLQILNHLSLPSDMVQETAGEFAHAVLGALTPGQGE